jgi:hypothetical protein
MLGGAVIAEAPVKGNFRKDTAGGGRWKRL